jgi:hypothetical protein
MREQNRTRRLRVQVVLGLERSQRRGSRDRIADSPLRTMRCVANGKESDSPRITRITRMGPWNLLREPEENLSPKTTRAIVCPIRCGHSSGTPDRLGKLDSCRLSTHESQQHRRKEDTCRFATSKNPDCSTEYGSGAVGSDTGPLLYHGRIL